MLYEVYKKPAMIAEIEGVIESAIPSESIFLPRKAIGRHSDAFIYILSGFCTYTFQNGTVFSVQQGDVLFLADGSIYDMKIDHDHGEYAFIFCDFSFAVSRPDSCVVTPKNTDEMKKKFLTLKKTWYSGEEDRVLVCMAILYHIYSTLVKNVCSAYMESSTKSRIQKAWQKIQSCAPNQKLRIATLAEDSGMSEVYFRKLFTELYGITPSRCIMVTRIAYAQKLMSLEFLTLEEIALQSGFSSLPHFCKVFQQTVGVTPAKYRNQLRNEI